MAKDSSLEADARAIRFRAECRLGDMMAEQRASGQMAKGTRGQLVGPGIIGGVNKTPPITPTIAEAGIDKNLAKAAREAAKLTESERDEHEVEIREAVYSRSRQRQADRDGEGGERRWPYCGV